MASLDDFRVSVSGKTGMSNLSASTDRTLLDRWANEAVRDVLVRTHCFVDFGTMATTIDERDYDLPSSILAVEKLQILDDNGNPASLDQKETEEIFDLREGLALSGTAIPSEYAVQGSNMLMLFPTPDKAYTLHIYYVPLPTELLQDTDSPAAQSFGGVPLEYHKAIEYYMLWQAGDHTDDRSSAQGERYKLLYDEFIAKIRGQRVRMGGKSVPPFYLPGTRLLAPNDPSTDLR
jgi:hypothetical protein